MLLLLRGCWNSLSRAPPCLCSPPLDRTQVGIRYGDKELCRADWRAWEEAAGPLSYFLRQVQLDGSEQSREGPAVRAWAKKHGAPLREGGCVDTLVFPAGVDEKEEMDPDVFEARQREPGTRNFALNTTACALPPMPGPRRGWQRPTAPHRAPPLSLSPALRASPRPRPSSSSCWAPCRTSSSRSPISPPPSSTQRTSTSRSSSSSATKRRRPRREGAAARSARAPRRRPARRERRGGRR